MKIEKITPQVAALYIGQKCDVEEYIAFIGDHTWEGVNIDYSIIGRVELGDIGITPHLRRLESLTEEEARELYYISEGTSWNNNPRSTLSCLKEWWNVREPVSDYNKRHHVGSPAVWLKLLEWGFDLFGLIDSGLAKEVEPKKD